MANATLPAGYGLLLNRCRALFGHDISFDRCIATMYYVSLQEDKGVYQCPGSVPVQRVEHNQLFFYSPCGSVEIKLLQWMVPVLMMVCMVGNVLNLLIYSLPYFDGSSSVHFLRAKAIFNIIFVWSRVFEVVHAWMAKAHPVFEHVFWHTRSSIMTLSNISGTMSTWLTLIVTFETLLCVVAPFLFRRYCTRKITWMFLICSLLLSTAMHSTLVFSTEVFTTIHIRQTLQADGATCWHPQISYNLGMPSSNVYRIVQKAYYWAQTAVAILIPTIAMLICTLVIIKQFSFKELGEAFSQRRRCVIRMTVATTLSHLLLEGPAALTHAAVALKGAGSSEHHYHMCILNNGNNMLSILNAAIPFFVFLLCNEQFRHMTGCYIKAHVQTDRQRKLTYLSQAGMRPRALDERSHLKPTPL